MLSRSVWNTVTSHSLILGNDMLYLTVVFTAETVDAYKWTSSSLYNRFRASSTRLWMTCLPVSVLWRRGWATLNSCPLKASLRAKCWIKSESTRLWVSHHSFLSFRVHYLLRWLSEKLFPVHITFEKTGGPFLHISLGKTEISVITDEVKWENGCVSGAVYWGDEKLTKLLVKVCIFVHISGLWHSKHQLSRLNVNTFDQKLLFLPFKV